MGLRIVSVSTVLFDGHPMGRAFDLIAAAGATHVEPAFIRGYVDFAEPNLAPAPGAALRRRARDAGLAVHAVSGHLDLSGDDAGAGLARRIALAEACGACILITNAGPAARRDRIEATLEATLPLCERAGIVLALENPGHGSGDLLGTGADVTCAPRGSAPRGGVGAPAFGEAQAGQAAVVGRLTGSVCTTRARASSDM